MRYLVLSDLHSNWEALQAVLQHAEGSYDLIACLGDFVGYGPDPNRVVEWARERVAIAVRGNHDRACTSGEGLDDFSYLAYEAALWTATELSSENAAYLRALQAGPLEMGNFTMVHGSPRDEDDYLVEKQEAEEAFHYVNKPLTLFGHTHLQGGFEISHGRVRKIAKAHGAFELNADSSYLINPGSVGQPRDLDPGAGYLIFEPGNETISFHRARYELLDTQRKIRSAGLPGLLADRLAIGK